MWIRYEHPDLPRCVRMFLSEEGVFYVMASDAARISDYRERRTFVERCATRKVRDLVPQGMQGMTFELLEYPVFSFEELELLVCWKYVEALKKVYATEGNVEPSPDWMDPPKLDETTYVEWVGEEENECTVPAAHYFAHFVRKTQEHYRRLSPREVRDPDGGDLTEVPRYVRIVFGEGLAATYVVC